MDNCESSFNYFNPTQYHSKESRARFTLTTAKSYDNTTPNLENKENKERPNFNAIQKSNSLNTSYSISSSHNVLTAIIDNDDHDYDPSTSTTSSLSSCFSTTSSNSSSTYKNIHDDVLIQTPAVEICPVVNKQIISNVDYQIDLKNMNADFISDYGTYFDTKKCLHSILNILDTDSDQNDLIKVIEDLFFKLQKRLDTLNAQCLELNELYDKSQNYEVLIDKLTKLSAKPKYKITNYLNLLNHSTVPIQVVLDQASTPICLNKKSSLSWSFVLRNTLKYFNFLEQLDVVYMKNLNSIDAYDRINDSYLKTKINTLVANKIGMFNMSPGFLQFLIANYKDFARSSVSFNDLYQLIWFCIITFKLII